MTSQLSINDAVAAVKRGLTIRTAARMYGVPKSTLGDKVKGKRPVEAKAGRNPLLSTERERQVVEYIVHMARNGYGRTYSDIESKVEEIIKGMGLVVPMFKEQKPGRKWFTLFMKRHGDEISQRVTLPLGRERTTVTADKVERWFVGVTMYLGEEGALDILDDPSRIYNADETGFPLAPKSGKVIASVHDSHVYSVTSSTKHQVTVMVACSATAHYIPPMVIIPGKRFDRNPAEDWTEVHIGRSDNGWMTGELFYNWVII